MIPMNPHPPTPTAAGRDEPGARHHFPPLDGLRGVAILLVLMHHCYTATNGSFFSRVVGAVAGVGWIGVTLFFVLSGFLITGILLESAGREHYYRNFYMRRVLRIFPLYYGFLLVYQVSVAILRQGGVTGWVSLEQTTWPIWFFLTNTPEVFPVGTLARPLQPLWSLAVEEQVYLVLPAMVAILPRTVLLRLFACALPAALMWRVGILAGMERPHGAYNLTPSCLDAFAAGGLVAILVRESRGVEILRRAAKPLAIASGFLLLAMFASMGNFNVWESTKPILSVGLTLLSIFFGSTIACSVAGRADSRMNRALGLPILRSFGRYSFALYLFHMIVFQSLHAVAIRVYGPGSRADSASPAILVFVATVGLTFLLAKASWHFYESPILRLKSAFPTPGRGVPAVPEAASSREDRRANSPVLLVRSPLLAEKSPSAT